MRKLGGGTTELKAFFIQQWSCRLQEEGTVLFHIKVSCLLLLLRLLLLFCSSDLSETLSLFCTLPETPP